MSNDTPESVPTPTNPLPPIDLEAEEAHVAQRAAVVAAQPNWIARHKALTAVIVVLVSVLGWGTVYAVARDGSGDQRTITGTFTLIDTGIYGEWDDCSGSGGYDDFGAGMNVTITDSDGKIIASDETESLTKVDADALNDETDTDVADADFLCVVKFETQVPDRDFYAIEIGKRGDLSYSKDELVEKDWHVELVLGSVEDLFD